MPRRTALVDLFKMKENDRIKWIADYLIENEEASFMVDMPTVPEGRGDGKRTKEERYLDKLRRLTTFEIVERAENHPVAHVVTIRIRRTKN